MDVNISVMPSNNLPKDLNGRMFLLVEKAQVLSAVESGRALRKTRGELSLTPGLPLDMPTRKPRKLLTPEELEERRKKVKLS